MNEFKTLKDLKNVFLLSVLLVLPSYSLGQYRTELSSPPILEELLEQSQSLQISDLPIKSRIEWYSKVFLNKATPYVVDPLGEGAESLIDRDPLYRFDGFDCTTFVETILSLSRADSVSSFENEMNQIRYQDGVVTYEKRNHFTGVDWVPNGVRHKIFKDITAKVGRDKTLLSQTWIDKKNWALKVNKMPSAFAQETLRLSEIPYIPKASLIEEHSDILNRIPSGTIINIVRPQWDLRKAAGTYLDVSHQGFAIREKGILFFRHASQGKTVVQEPLHLYMQRMMSVQSIGGIQILLPLQVN